MRINSGPKGEGHGPLSVGGASLEELCPVRSQEQILAQVKARAESIQEAVGEKILLHPGRFHLSHHEVVIAEDEVAVKHAFEVSSAFSNYGSFYRLSGKAGETGQGEFIPLGSGTRAARPNFSRVLEKGNVENKSSGFLQQLVRKPRFLDSEGNKGRVSREGHQPGDRSDGLPSAVARGEE